MNNRHLQLPLALALALGATSAHALGLGAIEVKSGLNQPLVAEIPILSAGPGELEELEVRLASPEAFARVGLERPVGLTANLQMEVGRNAAGQPVIRVTTPGRFNEPFLTFLIEANWGRGSVVREFSALVDPPYIAPAVIRPLEAPAVAAQPAPLVAAPTAPEPAPTEAEATTSALAEPEPLTAVADIPPEPVAPAAPEPEPMVPTPEPAPEPVAAAPEPAPQPEPLPEPPAPEPEPEPEAIAATPEPAPAPPPPAPVAPPPAPAPAPDSYGPVSEGQTLWSIASNARPDASVSVNQMMLALQRANPEAFIDDNINQLKRGAVLRIPASDEVAQIGAAEAAALVREQADAWQSRRQPVPQPAEAIASAPEPARSAAARPARTPAAEGRLEIVPPSGGELAARGLQSGASGAGGGSELRAELTQAREDLAAREAEVEDLRSQLAEIEQQQADSQRLIEMQSSQLKALQERLAAEGADGGESADTPAPAAETVATQPASPATAEAAPAAAPAAATADAPAQAEPAWYLNPLLLGGGGLVLLGGLVLALRGRRTSSPVPVVGRRISDDDALKASLPGARAAAAPAPAPAPVAAAEPSELEKLQQAVQARPDDLEAHISLLRKLYADGAKHDYEVAAQAMRIRVRSTLDPRWREAVVMGVALSPGNPLFSQAGWNSPRFGETGVMPATPAATPAAAPAPGPAKPAAPPPPAAKADAADLAEIQIAPAPAHADDDEDWDRLAQGLSPEPVLEPEDQPAALGEPTLDEAVSLGADGGEDDGSATKIELAKAYLDIGDVDGARGMLEEVVAEAGPAGRAEAERLLREIG